MKNSCNYWFRFLRAIVLVKNGKHGYLLENWGIQLSIRLSFEYILGRARKPWFLEPLFRFFFGILWRWTCKPQFHIFTRFYTPTIFILGGLNTSFFWVHKKICLQFSCSILHCYSYYPSFFCATSIGSSVGNQLVQNGFKWTDEG